MQGHAWRRKPAEKQRDAPPIINAEPPPLLTIVDFNLELLPDGVNHLYHHSEHDPHATQCPDVDFGLALHVCGDGATRVPEMLVALHNELLQPVSKFVRQARACIWAAMSQASYIGNVGSTISAGFANSAISSSKKISVADNHRLPLLSAFDAMPRDNQPEPSHVDTPYAGTYGCCFDHGVSPPGHLAHNYRSDKRHTELLPQRGDGR